MPQDLCEFRTAWVRLVVGSFGLNVEARAQPVSRKSIWECET